LAAVRGFDGVSSIDAMRRVAIYGGTFDPVHNGHVEVARRVQQLFELDEVIFVPACVPPHKRNANITSAFHRFAMLALATEADQRLLVSTVELDAPDRPYAVDTVARMLDKNQRLFFMMGADLWAEITTWHEWQKLLQMCDLIVVTRPGYEIKERLPIKIELIDVRNGEEKMVADLLNRKNGSRVFITDAAMVDVSATTIRAAAKSNDVASLKTMVPLSVASYIEKYGLYRN
jgi:nicotinate-nucleotide adenylyltransferase